MNNQHDSAEQLANVSTALTALADAKARVRIDAAERDTNTVGFVLGQYRAHAGLTEQELTNWLGIDLATLAELAEEPQPMLIGPDGAILQEMGLDQLAEVYGADRERLLEVFEHESAIEGRRSR
jgi:hypothetical protein